MSQPAAVTRAAVFDALYQIVENGYVEDFDGSGLTIYDCPPELVAQDLNRCDSDFDDLTEIDFNVLMMYVSLWQQANRP